MVKCLLSIYKTPDSNAVTTTTKTKQNKQTKSKIIHPKSKKQNSLRKQQKNQQSPMQDSTLTSIVSLLCSFLTFWFFLGLGQQPHPPFQLSLQVCLQFFDPILFSLLGWTEPCTFLTTSLFSSLGFHALTSAALLLQPLPDLNKKQTRSGKAGPRQRSLGKEVGL